MKLKTDKTKYIMFHKKYRTNFTSEQNKLKMRLDNTFIEKAEHPTLLGITVDKHLNFNYHFQQLRKKLTTKINLIYRLSSKVYNINPIHLITIYKSLILSKIQYSMLPFLVTSKTTQLKIQTMKNSILKRILKIPPKTST